MVPLAVQVQVYMGTGTDTQVHRYRYTGTQVHRYTLVYVHTPEIDMVFQVYSKTDSQYSDFKAEITVQYLRL